ncbi:tRNA-splicing endonuclease subunit Sen54 isoform X2 [Pseudophryne corroboree]|uniref:tRNA-splicing endonuclease subunit Sen54 isoform X2 n=1 Tax=Pseudophryne corroboree TaxID=495146 RepID=UPI0030813770
MWVYIAGSGCPGHSVLRFLMLSPAELLSVRSREKSLPQRSHGQKDFLPDGSEVQNEKLQTCRSEQWELLGEDRVERLGSLGRGVWKPVEELVELTLPAGTIQLFYKDLPLSVQEAYEKLLSHGTVTLLHYQVYSHLKRLGYIVTRFTPSFIQSPYERQLNLESCFVPHRKRKRSSSPRSKVKFKPETLDNNGKEDIDLTVSNSSRHSSGTKISSSCPKLTACVPESCKSDSQPDNDDSPLRIRQAGDEVHTKDLETCNQLQSRTSQTAEHTVSTGKTSTRSSRWDFTKIQFPNCASDQPCTHLPAPEPVLLPENVTGRQVDISRWLEKLNVRRERLSRKEQEQLDWERKYKISINADPKIKECTNWREYKELLLERGRESHKVRPTHLWASSVSPLFMPGHVKSTASVLEQITEMRQSALLGAGKRPKDMQNLPQIHFNLYQADGTSEFKKSKPGKPYARLCVRSFDEQIPSLGTVKHLTYQSGDVPVVFAIVDCGEIAFYTFKDFQLPVDVYP